MLWDIDGTLLNTGGAGAVAWQRAFQELYGVEANIDEHTRAGMTDPEITEIVFHDVVGRDGSQRSGPRSIAKYLAYIPRTRSPNRAGYGVKPGIEETLPRLAEAGGVAGDRQRQHRAGGADQARARRPRQVPHLRRLRLRRPRPHRGHRKGPRARRRGRRRTPSTRTPRSPSATPPATSTPATAPASASSASPPATTASTSSARPAPTGRSPTSPRASRSDEPGSCPSQCGHNSVIDRVKEQAPSPVPGHAAYGRVQRAW